MIYSFEGIRPVVHLQAFVHEQAVLIGDVFVDADCYIGPGACLRGDFGRILVGRGSNVQDNCVLHSFPGQEVRLEEEGHISHGAVLHGCIIEKNGFVGIQAVVMDGVVVEEQALVAAMSFVPSNRKIAARTLVAGVPARFVRRLHEEEIAWKSNGAKVYQELARRSRLGLKKIATPNSGKTPGKKRTTWSAEAALPLPSFRRSTEK